jgi:hypothetical protein
MRDFTADGGCTNGEFDMSSIMRLLKALEECGVTSEHCIADMGCAYGKMCWMFGAFFSCRVYGVELELERCRIASELYKDIEKHDEKLAEKRIAIVQGDLNYIHRLLWYTTVVYTFDNAMPMSTALHVITTAAMTPSIEIIASGKAYEEVIIRDRLSSLGFWLEKKVPCTMSISKEAKQICIFRRAQIFVPASPTVKSSMERPTEMEEDIHNMMLYDRKARAAGFEKMNYEVNSAQNEAKRRRKHTKKLDQNQKGERCDRGYYEMCEAPCAHCSILFRHKEDSVKVRQSRVHGKGLFAMKDMMENSFIMEVKGDYVETLAEAPPDGRNTWQLASSVLKAGFLVIEEDKENPFCFINHNCQNPNCVLIPWLDANNEYRYSLVTRGYVSKMDELTIDYGHHASMTIRPCMCPCCKPNEQKYALIPCMKYSDLGNRDVRDLVTSGAWTNMDGRDMNRILEMQRQDPSLVVLTANKEVGGATARADRHISGDFTDSSWVDKIKQFMVSDWRLLRSDKLQFLDMVIWDYLWNPRGYNKSRWGVELYRKHLTALAQLLKPNGYILFPFHPDVVSSLVEHEAHWWKCYKVGFLLDDQVDENPLWRATGELDKAELFGKSNDISASCCVKSVDLKTTASSSPESELMKLIWTTQNTDKIRFLRLTKRNM